MSSSALMMWNCINSIACCSSRCAMCSMRRLCSSIARRSENGCVQFPVVGPVRFDVRRGECRFPNCLVLPKPSYIIVRDALARETDAEALESRAKFIQLAYLLVSKLAHEPTLVWELDGKAVGFEPVHRLTHRRCAHLELACDN